MTADEISPEFLTFSEMLDQAESVDPAGLGTDGALLLELRQELRAEVALPPDFARTTSARVEQRFRRSPLQRGLVLAEPLLTSSVLARPAWPWSLLLSLAAGLAACWSWSALAWLGVGLLTFCLVFLGIKPRSSRWVASPGPSPSGSGWLFYLVPGLATLATGAVCGTLVGLLGLVSFSFRNNSSGLTQLAVAAGVAVSLLLLCGLAPTWRAWRRRAMGRLSWLLPGQLLHGLWLGVALQAITGSLPELSKQISPWTAVSLCLGVSLLVSLLLARQVPVKPVPGQLRSGLAQSFASLICGGVPILGALLAFYQLNLTREINDPALYESVVAETRQFMARQKALPAEQNGWMDLKKWLLRPAQENPEYLQVRARLNAGSEIFEHYLGDRPTADVAKAEADFLKELPRLEAALKKPYFSHLATQDLRIDSLVPDFLCCRAISRGLAGLAEKALRQGDTAGALHYHRTNLAWSGCLRKGVLINLMIGIAQMNIVLEPLQRWVLEGKPDAQQLGALASDLNKARIDRWEFRDTMKRECTFIDQAFQDALKSPLTLAGEMGGQSLTRLVPRSYWESERKACLNLELGEMSSWTELGRPSDQNLDELLALNVVARELLPHTSKAQVQFMVMLTRYGAAETVVALERYRRQHGLYPQRLEELMPVYLEELPVDVVSPKLWHAKPTLRYQRQGDSYELISESPLYPLVHLKSRQRFGRGHYQLDKLPQKGD